ncbi:hypothetical protein B0T17DRAFT_514340 [Bombardia bombarda]|uniref:Secreted protein n=1 Tax=Bombardia bombarda TaxID=252184 RepID=A0AA40CET6_9PEZI|nr:hypothetical protein B0T17DRAFT_514340 [Bombardia bombarda]
MPPPAEASRAVLAIVVVVQTMATEMPILPPRIGSRLITYLNNIIPNSALAPSRSPRTWPLRERTQSSRDVCSL